MRSEPAMRTFATLLLLVSGAALGYPIPPKSLWSLSQDASAIVVATVTDVVQRDGNDDERDSTVALLDVEEAWKGKVSGRLEVPFPAFLLCPAPPRYTKGGRVVAFLAKSETGEWQTVSLSYGTRYPEGDEARAELKAAVMEAVALQATSAANAQQRWGLFAFARPATRWDALFTLQAHTNEAQAYYARQPRQAALPPAVLDELERAFIARPSYDFTLPQVLRLFAGRRSKALDAVLVDVVDTALAYGTANWWLSESVFLLEERLDPAAAKRRVEAAKKDGIEREVDFMLSRSQLDEDALQQKWDELKKRLALKPNRRDDYVRHRPTGTGGETPF